jgi:hypothetical protein
MIRINICTPLRLHIDDVREVPSVNHIDLVESASVWILLCMKYVFLTAICMPAAKSISWRPFSFVVSGKLYLPIVKWWILVWPIFAFASPITIFTLFPGQAVYTAQVLHRKPPSLYSDRTFQATIRKSFIRLLFVVIVLFRSVFFVLSTFVIIRFSETGWLPLTSPKT